MLDRARTDRTTASAPLPSTVFEADLRATLTVTNTSFETIGGIQAPFYDVTANPDLASSCAIFAWPTVNATWQTWTSTPMYQWYVASDVTERVYYIESADMVVVLDPMPGTTVADVQASFAELLAGFQIRSSG